MNGLYYLGFPYLSPGHHCTATTGVYSSKIDPFFISIVFIVSLLFVKFQIHQPADHKSTLSPPVVKCSTLNSILLHLVSVVQTLSLMFQICRLEALDGARCCCHLVSKLSSIQPPDSSDTSLTLYCTKTSLDLPICCKCVNIVNNNL